MIHNCEKLIQCVCCGNTHLIQALDLGLQPPANNYIRTETDPETLYPLGLNFCPCCHHLQLTHAVDPDLLFRNYVYVSGTSATIHKYFERFVNFSLGYIDNYQAQSLRVLDIACNDGAQLDYYQKQGHQTWGIDPAENLYKISSQRHRVVCDYLTPDSIKKLGQDQFDIILAQNVFAHNSYPAEFLQICAEYLSPGGRIFIQTSQAHMLELGQFDTVYHEHISFFNLKSMSTLIQKTGLYLQDVQIQDIHGGSYVFVITKHPELDQTRRLCEQEPERQLNNIQKFQQAAQQTIQNFQQQIDYYRQRNYITAGYGAAAKGMTVLNYGNIDLDFIVDDNPLKQNLLTPGRHIPVIRLDQAETYIPDKPIAWFVLGWNFYDEIATRIRKMTKNSNVIIPLSFTKIN